MERSLYEGLTSYINEPQVVSLTVHDQGLAVQHPVIRGRFLQVEVIIQLPNHDIRLHIDASS